MGFWDIAKEVGKAAANSFLDEYASASRKMDKSEGAAAANDLKGFVNGELDWEGNPIDDDE